MNPRVKCRACRQVVDTRMGVPRERVGFLYATHLDRGVKCWMSGEQAVTDIDIFMAMQEAEVEEVAS